MMLATPTPVTSLTPPTLDAAYVSHDLNELLIVGRMAPSLHENAGAPARVVLRLDFATKGAVGAKLQLWNKTATRLAEAIYLSFAPAGDPTGGPGPLEWRMEKLGSWVDPLDVAEGASRGLHAVTRVRAVDVNTADAWSLETLDAG